MPLQGHHQIVSVDDHLIEHPRVWQDRVPAGFRDRAPRIQEVDGRHLWHYDGQVFPTVGLNAVAGKPREDWGRDPVRYEDMIPGCCPTMRAASRQRHPEVALVQLSRKIEFLAVVSPQVQAAAYGRRGKDCGSPALNGPVSQRRLDDQEAK